jgi:uncharacterized protein YdcH (DUF465 family)
MELADPEIRTILLGESDEFLGLVRQHAGFESRLEKLAQKPASTEEEWIEEIRLKKHKLVLKDQMAALIRDYRREKLAVTH